MVTKPFSKWQDQARQATLQAIEKVLKGQQFDLSAVSDWADEISHQTVQALASHEGYRLAATATIAQRKGEGINISSAAAWDPENDGTFTVRWENQSLYCIVVVFALAN